MRLPLTRPAPPNPIIMGDRSMYTDLPDTHTGEQHAGHAKARLWVLAWWTTLVVIGALGLALLQDSGHLLPHRVCVHATGSSVPPRCFDRGADFEITVNY